MEKRLAIYFNLIHYNFVLVLNLQRPFVNTRYVYSTIDNQRNGLETQAKALMTSVIRPDTLYFGTLYLHFKYISGLYIYISQTRITMSMELSKVKLQGYKVKRIRPYHGCSISNIRALACVSSPFLWLSMIPHNLRCSFARAWTLANLPPVTNRWLLMSQFWNIDVLMTKHAGDLWRVI